MNAVFMLIIPIFPVFFLPLIQTTNVKTCVFRIKDFFNVIQTKIHSIQKKDVCKCDFSSYKNGKEYAQKNIRIRTVEDIIV